jgi:putative PIN family toxin of toxin-antitoxin system
LIEAAGILGRAKFAASLRRKNLSAAEIVARYRELAETVDVAPLDEAALRDPDDAAVLACAVAARADAIVSGDDDLHALGEYRGIPVLSPAQALRRITAA